MKTFKELTWKTTLPLTIITFSLFTKWWLVDVIDGTEGTMYGFPLIYQAPAFYTSCAEEYFILELVFDFLFYFTVISIFIRFLNNNFLRLQTNRYIISTIYVLSLILIGLYLLLAIQPENKFSIHREDNILIKDTGFKFFFKTSEKQNTIKFMKP